MYRLSMGNKTLAQYSLTICTTWTIIGASIVEPRVTTENFIYYGSMLLAYYVFDCILYLAYARPNKTMFLIHHVITIGLMLLHIVEILPSSVGVRYLVMFEYSNSILVFWSLCHEQHWIAIRNMLTPFFVFTYVPFRLVAIPLYSLEYNPYLMAMANRRLAVSCFALLTFVNVFSIYFSIIIMVNFYRFVKRTLRDE